MAVSEAGLVGSASVELSVGLGADALGVTAGAVVSDDAGCVAEGEASGCADALAEADGEAEADGSAEALAVIEGLAVSCASLGGFTAAVQSLGLDALGVACSFLPSGDSPGSGVGSLLAMPGTGFGTTPASMAIT